MPKAAPVVEVTPELVALLQTWDASKRLLNDTKTTEMSNRLAVIEKAPFAEDKEEGGQTLKLHGGWKLKLTRVLNYSIETKDNNAVMAAVTQLGSVNPSVAAELIRWEPVMSVAAYKKLTEEEKKIVAPIVTIKPGTSALELVAPAKPRE